MDKKKFLFLGLALILASLFVSCSKEEQPVVVEEVTEEEPIYAVTVSNAVQGELKDYLEFGGDVSAKTQVDVLPDAVGKVVSVNVKVGDYVYKDQTIAVVDPSRAGMNYAQSVVKAPISGTITAVNAVVGGIASQQLSVAKIAKTDDLKITMNVPERYVSKIQVGQKAELRFDAYPGEVFEAVITEVSPVLDPTSRTMGVSLELSKKDKRIKAGMFARVKLITDTHSNIVIVSESALVSRYGDAYVFVVEPDSTVEKRLVKAGIRVDDKREILEGLSNGEQVVVRGQTLLEEGTKVNVVSIEEIE